MRSLFPKRQGRRPRGTVQLSPQLERRRALRQEKRRELLAQLWRMIVLLLASAGLGWLLLRHSWTLSEREQVVVGGDTGINAELVARVGGITFPQPLLEISPSELETKLLNNLPVRAVSVQRRGFPARLEVDLVGQMPIAHATRRRGNTTEKGAVDEHGHWIQPRADAPNRVPTSAITIEGWTKDHRPVIAQLLKQRNALGATLKTIVLHPNGTISLQTANLGQIDLGDDINRLSEQIAAIGQLSRTMPAHLVSQGKGKGTLDLSNPDRPELEIPVQPAQQPPQ